MLPPLNAPWPKPTQQIGIAYAAYYPNLTLTAEGGFESSAFIIGSPGRAASGPLARRIPETIFDAGLRRATVQQFVATYNADLASYRQTVLAAFQQVEDALAEVRILSKEIQQEQQAVDSAQPPSSSNRRGTRPASIPTSTC